MCFHISQTSKVNQLEKRFSVGIHSNTSQVYFDNPIYHSNGFAHPRLLIIPQEEPSVLVAGYWGIAPQHKKLSDLTLYYKDARRFGGGLNAQSEKLFDHFIYKQVALSRRCLIPITGFFEPHQHNKIKYPFYISRKDKQPFALGGIYSLIDGTPTVAILTKKASPLFEKIHNIKKRQPLLLPVALEQKWLNDHLQEIDLKDIIDSQYQDNELEYYAVSKALFNPKVNSKQATILDEFYYQNLK